MAQSHPFNDKDAFDAIMSGIRTPSTTEDKMRVSDRPEQIQIDQEKPVSKEEVSAILTPSPKAPEKQVKILTNFTAGELETQIEWYLNNKDVLSVDYSASAIAVGKKMDQIHTTYTALVTYLDIQN